MKLLYIPFIAFFLAVMYAAGIGSAYDYWGTLEVLGPSIIEEWLILTVSLSLLRILYLVWRNRT